MCKGKQYEDLVTGFLNYIGEDTKREGLLKTPQRVVSSWHEMFNGYFQDPKKLFTVFEEEKYDEFVVLKNISFVSFCEHHVLPFFGRIHIGYLASGKVLGASKLIRLVEIFTKRLQIQERISVQISEILMNELQPKGVGCVVEAQHICMMARGVKSSTSFMLTSSLLGLVKTNLAVRQEFFSLIK